MARSTESTRTTKIHSVSVHTERFPDCIPGYENEIWDENTNLVLKPIITQVLSTRILTLSYVLLFVHNS